MTGSIIAHIPELPAEKQDLFERIVENEAFETIELDHLRSLDFAIITGSADMRWESKSNPVVYDEEGGMVIVHLAKEGLESVIAFEGDLDNVDRETQQSDIARIREFTEKHGFDHLYEVASF